MFIWTIGDLIGIAIFGLIFLIVAFLFFAIWLEDKWNRLRKWLRRS